MELVKVKNNCVVTTSLIVAERFEKRHDNVLKEIERIKKEISDLEIEAIKEDRGLLNFEETSSKKTGYVQNWTDLFAESEYIDSWNRKQPMYHITKDGFMLLVMGFTGGEALKWKLGFIEAFNKGREALQSEAGRIRSAKDILENLYFEFSKPDSKISAAKLNAAVKVFRVLKKEEEKAKQFQAKQKEIKETKMSYEEKALEVARKVWKFAEENPDMMQGKIGIIKDGNVLIFAKNINTFINPKEKIQINRALIDMNLIEGDNKNEKSSRIAWVGKRVRVYKFLPLN